MDMPLPLPADAPIFDPRGFRLSPFEADLCARAQEFGARVLAPRAARWDREASFPTDNYDDMRREAWLGICIPKTDGEIGWAPISAPIAWPPRNSAGIAAQPR